MRFTAAISHSLPVLQYTQIFIRSYYVQDWPGLHWQYISNLHYIGKYRVFDYQVIYEISSNNPLMHAWPLNLVTTSDSFQSNLILMIPLASAICLNPMHTVPIVI